MPDHDAPRFRVVRLAELSPQPCPCGQARRAFVDEPEGQVSFHQVEIKTDSEVHYHRQHTEVYYVLKGKGFLELDGQRLTVEPGVAALIKPGCRHRAVGKMTILNVSLPVFDPTDEWHD